MYQLKSNFRSSVVVSFIYIPTDTSASQCFGTRFVEQRQSNIGLPLSAYTKFKQYNRIYICTTNIVELHPLSGQMPGSPPPPPQKKTASNILPLLPSIFSNPNALHMRAISNCAKTRCRCAVCIRSSHSHSFAGTDGTQQTRTLYILIFYY